MLMIGMARDVPAARASRHDALTNPVYQDSMAAMHAVASISEFDRELRLAA